MKLYVWTNHCTDWTSGLAVALAESEEEAKKLVIEAYHGMTPYEDSWGTLHIHDLDKPICYRVSGGG